MPEARDLCLTVGAAGIADRDLDDFEVEFGRAENEIEITEGIEVTEVAPVFF